MAAADADDPDADADADADDEATAGTGVAFPLSAALLDDFLCLDDEVVLDGGVSSKGVGETLVKTSKNSGDPWITGGFNVSSSGCFLSFADAFEPREFFRVLVEALVDRAPFLRPPGVCVLFCAAAAAAAASAAFAASRASNSFKSRSQFASKFSRGSHVS